MDKLRNASSQLPVTSEEFAHSNSQLVARQVTYDALVLDAGRRQALMTVRSLGSRGLRVAAVGSSAKEPTFSSRWCQQAFVCPVHEGAEGYLPHLEQLLDRYNVRVLMASSDSTIALIRQHRERLERRVRIALAKEPALGIAINKERTLEIAKQLGLGVPRAVTVRTVSEVNAALREIGLPAVVKPVESWESGRRLTSRLVTTPEEARDAVEDLTSAGGTILFQQFLSGRRESLGLLYANGQVHARFAQWAKRTTIPLGGQYALRQSIAIPPDIADQAERLVREIDLEGYSHVEFRRDSAGNPYLMEINPRLNASIEHAAHAGVDFPYLLYQWANGEQIDVVKDYRVGSWMRDLKGDMLSTLRTVRQRGRPGMASPARAVLDYCASFFMPVRYYDYVDWKDPLPACRASVNFIRNLPSLIRRFPEEKY